MPEPVSGTAKAISDVVYSLWERSAYFLWTLTIACAAVLIFTGTLTYLNIPDAQKVFSSYWIEIASANIFFLVCALSRSIQDYRNVKCLQIKVLKNYSLAFGWRKAGVSDSGKKAIDGRTELLYFSELVEIANRSKDEMYVSGFDISLKKRRHKLLYHEVYIYKDGINSKLNLILPPKRNTTILVSGMIDTDMPTDGEMLSYSVTIFDQEGRGHKSQILTGQFEDEFGPAFAP